MTKKFKELKSYSLSTNPSAEQIFQAFADWLFNDVADKIELRDLASLDDRLKNIGSGFKIDFIPSRLEKPANIVKTQPTNTFNYKDTAGFYSVANFVKKHGENLGLTEYAMRGIIARINPKYSNVKGKKQGNGFESVIVRTGTRIYIDEAAFFAWLDKSREKNKYY